MVPADKPEPATAQSIPEDRWHHVRNALLFYFTHHFASDPEGLAQETIYRVIAWLEKGNCIKGENGFEKVCFGFARLVLREVPRTRVGEELDETMPARSEKTLGLDVVEFQVLVNQLLNRLDPEERELAEHVLEGTLDKLAESKGIPIETLRVRVSRLREKLRLLRSGEK